MEVASPNVNVLAPNVILPPVVPPPLNDPIVTPVVTPLISKMAFAAFAKLKAPVLSNAPLPDKASVPAHLHDRNDEKLTFHLDDF